MDVDRGQETRQVIDEAREEEQPRLEQPVRDAVHTDREQPRIKQNFPARPRRWVARLDRIEIGDQPVEHIMSPATPFLAVKIEARQHHFHPRPRFNRQRPKSPMRSSSSTSPRKSRSPSRSDAPPSDLRSLM